MLPWEWQTTNISHLSQLCVAETLLEYLRSLALFSSTHPQLIIWNLHPRYGKLKILGPLCPSPWFAYRMELPLWGGKCRRPEATAPRMSPLQSRTVMLRHQLQRRGTEVLYRERGRPYEQSSDALSKGTEFIWNRVWENSSVWVLSKAMDIVVLGNKGKASRSMRKTS